MQIKNVGGSPAPVGGGSYVPLLRLKTYGPSGGSTFTVIDDDLPVLNSLGAGSVVALKFPTWNDVPEKSKGGFVGLFPLNASGDNFIGMGTLAYMGQGTSDPSMISVTVQINKAASGPYPAGFVSVQSRTKDIAAKSYVDQKVNSIPLIMNCVVDDQAEGNVIVSQDGVDHSADIYNAYAAGRPVIIKYVDPTGGPEAGPADVVAAPAKVVRSGTAGSYVYHIDDNYGYTYGVPQ